MIKIKNKLLGIVDSEDLEFSFSQGEKEDYSSATNVQVTISNNPNLDNDIAYEIENMGDNNDDNEG